MHIDKNPPVPPFLQDEQAQLSQHLLIAEILQSLDHFCGPLLSLSRMSGSLLYGGSEMDTVLQV